MSAEGAPAAQHPGAGDLLQGHHPTPSPPDARDLTGALQHLDAPDLPAEKGLIAVGQGTGINAPCVGRGSGLALSVPSSPLHPPCPR